MRKLDAFFSGLWLNFQKKMEMQKMHWMLAYCCGSVSATAVSHLQIYFESGLHFNTACKSDS